MIHHYQQLHQIPELGFEEFQTQKYLLSVLNRLKCAIYEVEPTGILAYFDFQKLKTIALRAEMDALPIVEETGLSYQAKNQRMHACGHDGHMAILLGVAEYLNTTSSNCNVILIFQPSEEIYGGALKIINNPFFATAKIDAIYGLHLFPNLPYGKIVTSKNLMASATEIDVEVFGEKSHLKPKSANAIMAANALIFQSKAKRNSLINWGVFEASGKRNIVCDYAHFEGSYRTFKNPLKYLKHLQKKALKIRWKYHTKIRINYRIIPSVKNSLSFLCNEVKMTKLKFYQAEDFAFYQSKCKTLFVLLGCGKNTNLHSSKFQFDLQLLQIGFNYYQKLINSVF